MDFGVRGTPTPRAHQRQIPGSARRPHSARQNRNPITVSEGFVHFVNEEDIDVYFIIL